MNAVFAAARGDTLQRGAVARILDHGLNFVNEQDDGSGLYTRTRRAPLNFGRRPSDSLEHVRRVNRARQTGEGPPVRVNENHAQAWSSAAEQLAENQPDRVGLAGARRPVNPAVGCCRVGKVQHHGTPIRPNPKGEPEPVRLGEPVQVRRPMHRAGKGDINERKPAALPDTDGDGDA